MNVIFVTSESVPFVATGGLGDVSGSLPIELKKKGLDISVVLPLYSSISSEYVKDMEFIASFNVTLGWRNQYCGVFKYQLNDVPYYFLDNEYYFKRNGVYGFFDDGERYAFFCRAVLEMIAHIDLVPDIIHLNDWQSSLIPLYLKIFYRSNPLFYSVKTITTIHNIAYQGMFSPFMLGDVLGIPEEYRELLLYNGDTNYLKSAIVESNIVSTVSPTYALEILDPWYAHGLAPLLNEYSFKLRGILNGIDTSFYDPKTDESIAINYTYRSIQRKKECKKALLAQFGLEYDERPVVSMVSRLVAHKGFDLVTYVFDDIINSGMRVILLGSGEEVYETTFSNYALKYPDSFGLKIGFIPELSKQIYAGSDMFLMPSQSEPCGLSQMIALRYGTIPIVRETGGLKDTVIDAGTGNGNGFTFSSYNAHDMLGACLRAKGLYENKELWDKLIVHAMKCDNSWANAANNYVYMYEELG